MGAERKYVGRIYLYVKHWLHISSVHLPLFCNYRPYVTSGAIPTISSIFRKENLNSSASAIYWKSITKFTIACPGFHQSLARMPLLCTELCIYLKSHQQTIRSFRSIFQAGPSIFVNTKEFQKNTKENMPSKTFCSHFSQDGLINLIPSPDCYIFKALSIDTYVDQLRSHIA